MFIINPNNYENQKSGFEKFFGKQFPAVFYNNKQFKKSTRSNSYSLTFNENVAFSAYGLNFSGKMYIDTQYRDRGAMSASLDNLNGFSNFNAGNMQIEFIKIHRINSGATQKHTFNPSLQSKQLFLHHTSNSGNMESIYINSQIKYEKGSENFLSTELLKITQQNMQTIIYAINPLNSSVSKIGESSHNIPLVSKNQFGSDNILHMQNFGINIPIQNCPVNHMLVIEQTFSANIEITKKSTGGDRDIILLVGFNTTDGTTINNRIDFY